MNTKRINHTTAFKQHANTKLAQARVKGGGEARAIRAKPRLVLTELLFHSKSISVIYYSEIRFERENDKWRFDDFESGVIPFSFLP